MSGRARTLDWLGRHLISLGGIGIIAAVLGIFVFILSEVWPLFQSPGLKIEGQHKIDGQFAIGLDPYYQIAYASHASGLDLIELSDGQVLRRERPAALQGRQVTTAVGLLPKDLVVLGTNDGRVLLARIRFELDYTSGQRQVVANFSADELLEIDPVGEPLLRVAYQETGEGSSAVAAITETGRVVVLLREQQQGLLGPGEIVAERYELSVEFTGEATQILVDSQVRQLLVSTDRGEVYEWRLKGVDFKPALVGRVEVSPDKVTAMVYLLGEVSIVVGDIGGQVSTWFKVEEDGERTYRKVHTFAGQSAAIANITVSNRDKQFITADEEGNLALHHMTSERTLMGPTIEGAVRALIFAPKADGFLSLGEDGYLRKYTLDNPHPEISFGILFGKIWYEGYKGEEFVWQSTGGTDEFESKISLIPLIFGTAKGTFYSMIFAVPLAVMAAIFTAEFARPKVRNLVKPTIEVMASLPSVILGFLAGLWLAPLLESHIAGTLLLIPIVSVVIIGGGWIWQIAPKSLKGDGANTGGIYLVGGVTLIGLGLAYWLGPAFERFVFDGNFLDWLRNDTESGYDQRNSLVVGFAMGFAVIPLIFTISEDALSSVPSHLRSGSLALGATAWQTAIRVVLPMALPGIFSATMIGLGRAIGETMIVLMATGNTPIMDWNIFNGMRTISANIAVELPEAPHQSTLYRVLFLSGFLLFIATFFINSLAEVVRQRLREKYNRL